MKNKHKFLTIILLGLLFLSTFIFFLLNSGAAVLNPQGIIGLEQKRLLVISTWLILLVVVPVIILTFAFAWRYRESNQTARYEPLWDKSRAAEIIWWSIPLVVVICLSVLAWKGSHELDPYQPIVSEQKTLTIEVVALDWKWLFLYPEQGIATVNEVRFPEKTPVLLKLTADAPMNSFWIPRLGGQIYAMPGMVSKLYLMANQTGVFRGSSANLSGRGFAQMTFKAHATSNKDFENWVRQVKESSSELSSEVYQQLVMPSEDNPPASYTLREADAFYRILMNTRKVQPSRGHDVW